VFYENTVYLGISKIRNCKKKHIVHANDYVQLIHQNGVGSVAAS